MALLGWIPAAGNAPSLEITKQPRFIQNESGRFESRFSAVRIEESPSILLKGMEGSTLGVWVAHGEGQAFFPEKSVLDDIRSNNLAPLRYVNDANEPTESYPFNPNGAIDGIASLCSADGRHLAMMPHPERCFLTWQQPWMPDEWQAQNNGNGLEAGPWLKLFQNAREWCVAQKQK